MKTGKDCFKATRRLRAALLTSSALVLAWMLPATPSRGASDGTWLTSPSSNDYNTGSNWSGGFVPVGTATFGASDTTSLVISSASVGGWTFNAGASNYTFNVSNSLNFTGAGITINGGSATITNNSSLAFQNTSTAGGATINNNSSLLQFGDSSTAGNATITNNNGSTTIFYGNSTAGNAAITNTNLLFFYDYSTAGSATITNNGGITFQDYSTAGTATITVNGSVTFQDNSTAGAAAIVNNANALVDFSQTAGLNGDNKISAGSIAGAGLYLLGANELTVGSNNSSTEVSGVIAGTGGSLVKIGTGTLTLSGANTYTGGTTINGGTLQLGTAASVGTILGTVTVGASGTFDVVNANTSGVTSISNEGAVIFRNTSSAGSATITSTGHGTIDFYDQSTAGSATIINSTTDTTYAVTFHNISSAGTANLSNDIYGTFYFRDASTAASATINNANNRTTAFYDNSTAGHATINNDGLTYFYGTSSAGSATITNSSTGQVIFQDSSTAANAIIGGGSSYTFIGFYDASSAGSATITANGQLSFRNTSTAGSATITVNNLGYAYFLNTSTAGTATINNDGSLSFGGSSTAGNAVITSTNSIDFRQNSTAGSAAITNNGSLNFGNSSTAASATITNNFAASFNSASTAGSATINNTYNLSFTGTSTAGNAVITNNTGGPINPNGMTWFRDNATAGNAQLINNGANTFFDFSGSSGPNGDNKLSAGSIAGDGTFYLGAIELTVGSNNLSTTVSGVIADGGYSGATGGSLVKTGTGTLTLTGTNTYTGGTTFAGGTVSVASEANLGDLAGSLTFKGGALQITGTTFNTTARTINWSAAGGTFDIADAANNFTVSQGLSGGGLTKSGAGTLTLTGADTFSGVTIADGKLVFLDTTAGSTTITNNAQLAFYGNSTAGNAIIINSGNVLFDGNSTPDNAQLINTASTAVINFWTPGPSSDGKLTAGSIAGNGRFDLNSIELTVGSSNLSTEVTGVLTGDGSATGTSLIKVGTGTLTLSGVNTYTGATIVDGGALVVNGSIAASSSVTVNSGATLGGGGTVGTTTVNAGGTLLAGNGTANSSLTVAGSLALQSGAFYMVQINPATSSYANVSGTATLGGSTLQAVYANGSYVNKQYTILTAGSINGTFGSVVQTNLPSNFHSTVSYDGTHAYLNLVLNFVAPSGSGLSGNQQSVGNAIINSFNTNGGISLVYSGLTAAGLTQASGETAAGSQGTTFQAMGQFMGLLTDPSGAGRDTGGSAPPAYADSAPAGAARDAFAMLAKAPTFEQRWNVWASGFAGSQTTDGSTAQGSNSTTSRLFGTAAGAEYAFSPQTLAGFALAGGGTSFSVTGGGTGRSDLFQAGAYLRHANGPSYISAALAYGWQDVTTDRTVTLAGVDRLRAEFNANAWSGRIEGGYRFVAPWIGGIGVTPYAAGQFTTFNLPGYAESVVSGSNAFALAYGAKSVTDPRSELGLRTDKSFAMANGVLTLRGRAAWAHDFNPDHSVAATFQALPGASFVVNGARAASDSALTTASAEMKWLNGWSAAASFEGEFSNVTRSYAGKGTVRYAW
ncbi:autotransporter domain-containing protein [Bradyrhizobium sp. CCGUVB1N3]|uniref:beta strand repeat-containing protein n=1 Tax=Bradyrhizobium sp. CCGUVB1N3 TaxID=2949629 RepID=UPI0020B1ECC5|nr:autotransporter domain-containing protein [Bradyrhizobium sp. CCGUVB1N3]MCP3469210.1 autotransporter domain-containing protein [Bradyrhizobium sp. CCGUVB1N3]